MIELKNKNNLIWLDMEMSGLDPEKDQILEVATIVTDKDLNVLEEGPNLVVHQPAKVLNSMDEWNQKQHKKSGLVELVKRSKISVRRAEQMTLEFLERFCLPRKSPLCGNAVHHDRRFIIKYMPKLDAFLHYRHVDVSTIKVLVHNWYPKTKDLPQKSDAHRAQDDIRDSIKELVYYRKHFFKNKRQQS